MRSLIFFIALVVIYYALKSVLRSAMKTYRDERDAPAKLKGEEMVLDPECRTYVVRDRATTRRVQGQLLSFCSEDCARRYEERHRR